MIMGKPTVKQKKIVAKLPPTLKAGDKGGLRKLAKLMEKHMLGGMKDWSVQDITDWTVKEAGRIATSRKTEYNPDGWSSVSRILHVRLRAIGALFKRMADRADLGRCYRLNKDARRDIGKIVLIEDKEMWLEANGIPRGLPEWREWIRCNSFDRLKEEIQHLKSLTTRERREDLRRLHGDRMRRIQDDADEGKIGAVIRNIMANSKSFSLDVL